MKNLVKCQEVMFIQEDIYQIICVIQKYYNFIGVDLSRQANTSIPQQFNSIGKLEEDDDAAMFYIAVKKQKLF